MKKPMDPLKKMKLIYLLELLIFVALFIVLGILILLKVILIADWKRLVFSYLTLIGGAWIVTDFIWTLASPKRRAKNSMFDKALVLPAALFLIGFDIYAFSQGLVHIPEGQETNIIFNYVLGANLLYLALVYTAEAIYHWFRPLPLLLESLEEEQRKEEAQEAVPEEPIPAEENKEEVPTEEPKEEK